MRQPCPSAISAALSAGLALVLAAGCSGTSMRVQLIPPLMPPARPRPAIAAEPAVLFQEPFDRLDPSQWREVEVKGQTRYSLDALETGAAVKAHSLGGASILPGRNATSTTSGRAP